MSDATRLDAPIQRGPLMRWQRKAMESGVRNLSVSDCKCERRQVMDLSNDHVSAPPPVKKDHYHVLRFYNVFFSFFCAQP